MNTQYFKKSRAFTLVETLVAIAILMISISGPLAIANKALTASLYAKDQSTASFLAQEEMEIVKNIKDENVLDISQNHGSETWLEWGGSIDTLDNTCLSSQSQACDFDLTTLSPPGQLSRLGCPSSGCPLYINTNGYNHYSGSPTIFYRKIYLSPILNNPNEYQATVIVSWNEGTVSNAVTLSSELVNVAP